MANQDDTGIGRGKQIRRPRAFGEDDPWRDMEGASERLGMPGLPRFFRESMLGDLGRLVQGRVPRVDVIDGDTEVKVRAELPGVDRKDLDVSVTGDSVLIEGSTRREEREEKEHYFRSEITRGQFSRSIDLPAVVDSERARATFRDGILELVLPKTEGRQRRTISVE